MFRLFEVWSWHLLDMVTLVHAIFDLYIICRAKLADTVRLQRHDIVFALLPESQS
jgi:hypothetical protein